MKDNFNSQKAASERKIVLTRGVKRKNYVRGMFNTIARRYDFLNHFLSAGIDIYWRKKAIARLTANKESTILDLASGTADFAIEAVRRKDCHVIAVDIAKNMLFIAKKKLIQKNLIGKIKLVNGDGEGLPFKENFFDGITISFGIRNMGTISGALAEIFRLLKNNGQVIILEFSLPTNSFLKIIYLFYFKNILPFIGKIISKEMYAYSYLPASVEKFHKINEFIEQMGEAGFQYLQYWKLFNGIAVVYKGWKKNKK